MSARQTPQDDNEPVYVPAQHDRFELLGAETVSRHFATFICGDCEHIFAGDIPAIFCDLPRCPLCTEEAWIFSILEHGTSH